MTDAEKYQDAFLAYTTENLHEAVAPSPKEIAKRFDLPVEGLKIKIYSGGWDTEREKNRADFIEQVNASSAEIVTKQAESYTEKIRSILEQRIEDYIITNEKVNEQIHAELDHKDMDIKFLVALKKINIADGNALLNIVAALHQMEQDKEKSSTPKKEIAMSDLPNVLGMKITKTNDPMIDDDEDEDPRKTAVFEDFDN